MSTVYATVTCDTCGHDHAATFQGVNLTRVSDCDECGCTAEAFVASVDVAMTQQPSAQPTPRYTPGRWWPVSWTDGKGYTIEAAKGHLIANVTSPDQDNEANAQLMSAAPDLLEAAKVALEAINWSHPDRLMTDEEAGAVALLRAAIAKAEGRS